MNFKESPEFQKDIKALSKKVRTLESDLEPIYALIEQLYTSNSDEELKKYRELFFNSSVATILHQTCTHEVIKMRLDTETSSMKGKLRLVFVAVIIGNEVIFIELYAKNVKSREDQVRIKKYLN
jgi:hypothetical protein